MPWLRRARVTVTVALAASGLVAGPLLSSTAQADTTTSAQAKVTAVLAKVHALQAQALQAEKRYQVAFSRVADSVDTSVAADRSSGQVDSRAAAALDALDTRVREIYESGGTLDVVASLIVDGDASSFSRRAEIAARVLAQQSSATRRVSARADSYARAASQASRQVTRSIGTERSVAVAALHVQNILSEEHTLLQQADAHLAAVKAAQAALAAQAAALSSITTQQIAGLQVLPPSPQYLTLYQGAAKTCPGLPWTVLAAIGQVESGHGRNPSTSSAGAMGPMQFEPGTFAAYGVDGDHNGTLDIMSPADAIYTAARYLCADGASSSPSGLDGAILHYNHAGWYVAMVLKLSGEYAQQYS